MRVRFRAEHAGDHELRLRKLLAEHAHEWNRTAFAHTRTICGWKGTASYYHVEVDGERNPDAAWYYPEPKEAAHNIRGHVAFWKGVQVER
jgi:uncharacterized protein (DUF427 family)